MADIAQQIIDAVKSGKPDYVVTGLLKDRSDKIKKDGLSGKVPTNAEILDYAASFLKGGSKSKGDTEPETKPIEPVSVISSTPPTTGGGILGYDPAAYVTAGDVSTSGKTFAGYAIVALVGIVIIDRLLK